MLWTTQQFPKDFVLKLEFRATPNADSGIFLRDPQLQCRDYLLAGPYKLLQQYRPQDWNEIEVHVKDGKARCTCNGEVLEAAYAVPATGPIGLRVTAARWSTAASGYRKFSEGSLSRQDLQETQDSGGAGNGSFILGIL